MPLVQRGENEKLKKKSNKIPQPDVWDEKEE